MTDELLEAKIEADRSNRPYAVLHVVGVRGATPSTVGKSMIVTLGNTAADADSKPMNAAPGNTAADADGPTISICRTSGTIGGCRTAGTIGGGKMERDAVADAVSALRTGQKSYVKTYDGGGADEETLVCSPHSVDVFCEIFRHEMIAVIAGNGHVGQKMIELCRFLDIYTILFDNQEAYARNDLASECHHCAGYRKALEDADIPEGAYYFIGTDSHENDKEALAGILKKHPKYIGMLGSRRKVTTVCDALKAEGFESELFEPLYSPAGLGIANKKPAEVAFSIISEMLMLKNGGDGASMRIPQI